MEEIISNLKNTIKKYLILNHENIKITHIQKTKIKYLGFYISSKPNLNILIEAPIDYIINQLVHMNFASTNINKINKINYARSGNNPGNLSVKPRAITK